MKLNCRLQSFVGCFSGSKCFLQPQHIVRVIRTVDVPYRSNHVSVKLHKYFTSPFKTLDQVLFDDIEEDQVLSYKEYLSQTHCPDNYAQVMMKALDCNKEELKKIQESNIYWKNFPLPTIQKRVTAYKELGVRGSDLVKHSSLIFSDFEHMYEHLNSLCNSLGYNGHDLFPILLLRKEIIDKYLERLSEDSAHLGNYENRIKYFSSKFNVPVRNLTETFKDHPYMLTSQILNLTDVMDALLDGGIAKEHIFKDLHIFRYRVARIMEKIEICKKAGLRNIKPWILRAAQKTFWRSAERMREMQEFGNCTWTEFVAMHLNSSEEEVRSMIKYDKRCVKANLATTKKSLDYLLSLGFNPEQILQNPQAAVVSLQRLKARINMLKEAGIEPVRHPEFLRRMCHSNEEFIRNIGSYRAREKNVPQ